MTERHLSFRSDLLASAEEVWRTVSTMDGVNAELGPWLKMTSPARAKGFRIEDAPLGEIVFPSWLLAFGVLPIDRHALAFDRVDAGRGFFERSSSWTEREWRHDRAVLARGDGGSTVTDELRFTPRITMMAPVLVRIVRSVFTHRHARLRARFGASSTKC